MVKTCLLKKEELVIVAQNNCAMNNVLGGDKDD